MYTVESLSAAHVSITPLELFANDSDDVRVSMTYEHKGQMKIIEKRFHFTKSFDGEIGMSNYSHTLFERPSLVFGALFLSHGKRYA